MLKNVPGQTIQVARALHSCIGLDIVNGVRERVMMSLFDLEKFSSVSSQNCLILFLSLKKSVQILDASRKGEGVVS